MLKPPDHFGEIAMIYNCRRSATVTAFNYLTCAQITRQNYNELLQTYPVLNALIKKHVVEYDDPVKLFLEMSLNQIDFFKGLSREVKAEWIYNMTLKQYEAGHLLYQLDTDSEEMYVIQSGLVEICHELDKPGQEEFVIERLYRGSVVNHNSFLMNDGIDTDAKCKTPVSVFIMTIETVKRLRQKHYALDVALTDKEIQLVNPDAKEPALDYIIRDPYSHQHFLKHMLTGKVI